MPQRVARYSVANGKNAAAMAAADNSHANFAGAGAEEVVAIIQKVENGAGIEEQHETRV